MTVEATIFTTLRSLVGDRCYPDNAPEGAARPYVVYQHVGGPSINFLDSATIPDKSRPRYQVNVWADTRAAALAVAKQVEAALRAATSLQPTVEGEAVAQYDPDVKLHGTQQDFSFFA